MDLLTIRPATVADAQLIVDFITKLAVYEHMLDDVVTDAQKVRDVVFTQKAAEVLIAQENDTPIGFALFFHNYSTFAGKKGLYLEDLFIDPPYRGKGYGKRIFAHLAQIAKERDCARMEWSCLNWNAPSIAFYEGMDAVGMKEWTVYRLTQEKIAALAASL